MPCVLAELGDALLPAAALADGDLDGVLRRGAAAEATSTITSVLWRTCRCASCVLPASVFSETEPEECPDLQAVAQQPAAARVLLSEGSFTDPQLLVAVLLAALAFVGGRGRRLPQAARRRRRPQGLPLRLGRDPPEVRSTTGPSARRSATRTARSATPSCSCTARPARRGNWLQPTLADELFGPASRSTPRSTSSSSPTARPRRLVASRATACARRSPATATATWSRPSIGC